MCGFRTRPCRVQNVAASGAFGGPGAARFSGFATGDATLAENCSAFFLLTLQFLSFDPGWNLDPPFSFPSSPLASFIFLFLMRQRETDVGGDLRVSKERKKGQSDEAQTTTQKPDGSKKRNERKKRD